MIKHFRRLALLAATIFLMSLPDTPVSTAFAEENPAARELLEAMTVEERIGQLFMVTFQGVDTGPESDIAQLILDYHIGGVVLLAENDNVAAAGEAGSVPEQLARLNNALQQLAMLGVVPQLPERESGDLAELPFIRQLPDLDQAAVPLLIGTYHEGERLPSRNILSGVTEIPSNMAVGASWDPEYARTVGAIVGQELSAMGFNLLLGPSLDVVEDPMPFSAGDLGTQSFGGDPYWVGLMAKAYTVGVHSGAGGAMAVIPKHFPGQGSSDRPVNQEVATVRKSLEQLRQIELAPFFEVTSSGGDEFAVADGLLTSHIRYQGFQGNIRATTNPISFDRSALTTLMELPEFAAWRSDGGVIVSDSLGVRAVKRFYDETGQEFPHRRIAKDALIAGNDLLYLADFSLADGDFLSELDNIKDTVAWFQALYSTDQSFQQRVDEAVLRVLSLKLKLYGGEFTTNKTQVDIEALPSVIGHGGTSMFELAQTAVSLISPSPAELLERLNSPPAVEEKIVIFTDIQPQAQCGSCPPQPLISATALEDKILSLYGPDASGQVSPAQIDSFAMDDLQAFLASGPGPIIYPTAPITATVTPETEEPPAEDAPTATPAPTPPPPPAYFVQEALREADWIIFATLAPDSTPATLKQFLAERPDITRRAKAIVFAYNAPYYLDTTEISKLTAFFAVYSSIDPFIDASVRVLFQESLLSGHPPVDVSAIGYDLFQQTQPDPEQIIELFILSDGEFQSPPSEAPLEAAVGNTLQLRAGGILDRNGHLVPDGTIVQFIQLDRVQGLVSIIAEVPTQNGMAQLDYVLEARTEAGQYRITAKSGQASISQEVDISIEGGAQVAIITPTPMPTMTPLPSPTATTSPSATPTDTPKPTATATPAPAAPEEPSVKIELSEFQILLSLLFGLLLISNIAVTGGRRQMLSIADRIEWPLWGLIGALLGYIYFTLQLPGVTRLPEMGSWSGLLVSFPSGLLALLLFQVKIVLNKGR